MQNFGIEIAMLIKGEDIRSRTKDNTFHGQLRAAEASVG